MSDPTNNPLHPWPLYPAANVHPIVVHGAGGHGRVVLSILHALGIQLMDRVRVMDDGPDPDASRLASVGSVVLRSWPRPPASVIVGIGDNHVRQSIARDRRAAGWHLYTAIHPTATVDGRCLSGCVVCAHAHVGPEAMVGEDCIINTGAVVEHDARVGACSHVGPRAVVLGGAVVGKGCFLGAGSIVLPGVVVPDWTTIGAGAVVTRDCELGEGGRTVVGLPAKRTLARPRPVLDYEDNNLDADRTVPA